MLVDGQTQDVVGVLQVEALGSCSKRDVRPEQEADESTGQRVSPTGRQVLDDGGSSCVEHDVSAVVQVVKIVPAVETPVPEDVFQLQLLRGHDRDWSGNTDRYSY